MPVQKRSFSLDPFAATYLERRAKRLKRSASSVLSELIAQAAQQEARDRVIDTLGEGVDVSERDVERWLRKLGAL
jgi:2-methylcitrate dehydratase PrpD